ncbi:MAG: hypothetical protein PUF78_07905 [Lachnospiraceae bacterium]|jgi:hypothetical protein|nr:hypothetical protein [Lachnospiraceae bacterium]DAL46677.1 MAG TPA_asm: hypothetical protein [Caudoviricetes sp.]
MKLRPTKFKKVDRSAVLDGDHDPDWFVNQMRQCAMIDMIEGDNLVEKWDKLDALFAQGVEPDIGW